MSEFTNDLNAALEGRYRIERELGSGGMATVYLADDLKHDRRVALKVLKRDLAALVGAARFLEEVKTTAKLQHPLIVQLFDSGEADGFLYYVMPYLEGESLRQRLIRERQLPVDEAVRIASDVAEALHVAHELGIVHRDVKPANILMSRGRPLVADFGIALALRGVDSERLTAFGQSVGTPQYMSPEQAMGDVPLGPASDIYALGCVLYEMLVGEPPFRGPTNQAVLGRVLSGGAPSVSTVRTTVPANVDAAIRKSLEKIPSDRFLSAEAFAEALQDPAFPGDTGNVPSALPTAALRPWKLLSMYAIGVALVMTFLALWPSAEGPPRPLSITPVAVPENQRPMGIMEVSADGGVLIYEGPAAEDAPLLMLRRDALTPVAIPGTEGGTAPALAPDGRTIAFLHDAELRVIESPGGTPRAILTRPGACCLRWGGDGAFVYFTEPNGDLARIPAGGATQAEVVVRNDGGSGGRLLNGWPTPLPGGDWAAFQTSDILDFNSRIQLVNLRTGEVEDLTVGRFPRYSNGYLMFAQQSGEVLMAMPFDPIRRVATGPVQTVARGVSYGGGPAPLRLNPVPYAVSSSGVVTYTSGREDVERMPVWVTRDGSWMPMDSAWSDDLYTLALSPDGDRVASYDERSILVKQLPRGPVVTLARDLATMVYRPSWSPDGDSIVFTTFTVNDSGIRINSHIAPADGSGPPADLGIPHPHVIASPDGQWMVYRTAAMVGEDIYAIRRDGSGPPRRLVASDGVDTQPAFSRDGRFLAYASDVSGRMEVYVIPFLGARMWREQISVSGGYAPVWAHSGNELFYRTASDQLAVATLDTSSGVTVTSREVLFSMEGFGTGDATSTHYDIDAGDDRFAMFRILRPGWLSGPRQMVIIDDLDAVMEQSWSRRAGNELPTPF